MIVLDLRVLESYYCSSCYAIADLQINALAKSAHVDLSPKPKGSEERRKDVDGDSDSALTFLTLEDRFDEFDKVLVLLRFVFAVSLSLVCCCESCEGVPGLSVFWFACVSVQRFTCTSTRRRPSSTIFSSKTQTTRCRC